MPRRLLALSALLAAAVGAAVAQPAPSSPKPATQASAIFAGGCFWCVESDFDKVKGVISTTSGYIGGHLDNPTYKQVSGGSTGHAEAVEVVYDPSKVTYEKLLHVFWRTIDPLAKDRQFCDTGSEYRSAIFVRSEEQKKAAEASKKELVDSKRFSAAIQTQIVAAGKFYAAEDYHQDFYLKNPTKYKFYRWNCGRDQRLKELWGSEAGGETS
jgi:peptide-methionine (S)-S-oxide reductase